MLTCWWRHDVFCRWSTCAGACATKRLTITWRQSCAWKKSKTANVFQWALTLLWVNDKQNVFGDKVKVKSQKFTLIILFYARHLTLTLFGRWIKWLPNNTRGLHENIWRRFYANLHKDVKARRNVGVCSKTTDATIHNKTQRWRHL